MTRVLDQVGAGRKIRRLRRVIREWVLRIDRLQHDTNGAFRNKHLELHGSA